VQQYLTQICHNQTKYQKESYPGIVILVGIGLFLYWFLYNPTDNFAKSIPGLDNRPPKSHADIEDVIIGEHFTDYGNTLNSTLTGKWPNFRGADYDNINKEEIPLINKWPETGPNILWEKDLGEGHAGAAIYNGRVYVLDYEERKERDVLRCYGLEDGTELWRRGYSVDIKRNHGMSRTIPAVNDKYVVTMGPKCHVMCCDAKTGELKWGIDLIKDYRTDEPLWYTGQCPIIDNNVAVIGVGGSVLAMGVDCETGDIVWETPNPDSLEMSHASIVPMTIAGKKMYIYNALGGLCGISAEANDMGKLLWVSKDFTPSVIAPTPVYVGENRIFVTAGYGAGSALIQINKTGNTFSAQTLQKFKPSEGMASEQQTPIYKDGVVFNVQTKDAGTSRMQFVCCKADDFTNIVWTSSTTERFGLGPYMIADNKFFVMNDEGEVTIARYSTSKFEVLDKVQIMKGDDTWAPFALADGFLILRDSKKMVCIDIRKHE
jgi:outer membrane protein assembly factor BamB